MTVISVRKIMPCIVSLGLITWLAALVTGIFYESVAHCYRHHSVHGQSNESASVIPQPNEIQPFSYYQPIIARDLFKTRRAEKAASPNHDDTEQLETARLDVRLWGTVSGSDSRRFAVIEAKDSTNRRQQHLYREGDTIAQARIEKILRDKVVISLNGQRQMLLLEEYKSQAQRRPIRRATGSRRVAYRRIIRRATIANAVSNVGQLMTQAKILPRKDGLTITAIKPGSLFRRLGLRNGDVIEGVNGQGIQSVDDALSIYSRLRNDASVTVDIKRRGRKRTMQYTIR